MFTSDGAVLFHRDELDLIAEFAGCSLDEKPGSNWVQAGGGLPDYVCHIARAVKRTGKTTSQAIAIAVSRVKKWAAGGDDVDADTRAKAAKALAEWEKLKAKSKGKKDHALAATNSVHDTLMLANAKSFNVETVKSAWELKNREARQAWFKNNPNGRYEDAPRAYSYVKEQWTDFLIVQDDYGRHAALYKVPYTVEKAGQVSFDAPTEVKTQYVTVKQGDMTGDDITDGDMKALMATAGPCPKVATDQVLLSITTNLSALNQVLNAKKTS